MDLPRLLFLGQKLSAPSFRLRLASLAQAWREMGGHADLEVLPRRPEIARIFGRLHRWRAYDLLVISKFKFVGPEGFLVHRYAAPWIYDVDDAVMFGKPKHHEDPPDASFWRKLRFNAMCRRSSHVVTATEVLAKRIPGGTPCTTLPTPVDCTRYPVIAPEEKVRHFTAVWIGIGKNLRYLSDIIPALVKVREALPDFKLRIVSDRNLDPPPPFPVELVPWSVEGEGRALAESRVGLAPLPDDLWTTGKGGYKMIQYMAAGLPVLASPLAAQREIGGEEGQGVLYCASEEDWVNNLLHLAGEEERIRTMGRKARRRAEELYDIKSYTTRYLSLIQNVIRTTSYS